MNLLVKQGVLNEDQAQALIKQADDEAYVAREAAKGANARADEAAKAANAATAAASPPGTRHVTYVPEIVKRQLREEIKREVMDKAHKENWASPGAYPEWAQRIRFFRRPSRALPRQLLSCRQRPDRRFQFQCHQHRIALRRQ
ncbi:putative porin [Bradyrhizobium sp. RDT10]